MDHRIIKSPHGPTDGYFEPHYPALPVLDHPSLILSRIARLFNSLADMGDRNSSSGAKKGKARGRRASTRVPCDDCIARASTVSDRSSLQLCERCTLALHRPRKRAQEQGNARRVRRQSSAIIDTALGARTDPVDVPWSPDRQEQHALEFFVRQSAPQLAGYFDSPFWQRMVLQAGRHEPAVRHAIAAIGALHEKLLTGSVNLDQAQDKQTSFALEQCNKSIKHLTTPEGSGVKPDLRLMLTTCVLFTCFEALQGHCEQAIAHATQGYTLLQQYATDPESKRWDVGAFAVELDQLCLLMRRLQTQSKGLMGKDFNIVPEHHSISARRPTRFNNLQEARAGLELVLNQLTVFFLDMELDDRFYDLAIANAEKHLVFSPWLAAWEAAFSDLLTRERMNMNAEDHKAAMVLKAHEIVAEILSDVDLSLGELGWDAFYHKFEAIVNLATAVLDGSKQSDTSIIEARWKTSGVFISTPTATLSFSLGIVDPLYEVCARCRDPGLRRRALELLARHPRQEMVWSSWSAWKVGKFLMRLEEEGTETQPKLAADIPAESRVSQAWIDFSDKSTEETRKGGVGYKKALPRTSARYALNPGLFEDWQTEEPGFGEPYDFRSHRSNSSASSTRFAPSHRSDSTASNTQFTGNHWTNSIASSSQTPARYRTESIGSSTEPVSSSEATATAADNFSSRLYIPPIVGEGGINLPVIREYPPQD